MMDGVTAGWSGWRCGGETTPGTTHAVPFPLEQKHYPHAHDPAFILFLFIFELLLLLLYINSFQRKNSCIYQLFLQLLLINDQIDNVLEIGSVKKKFEVDKLRKQGLINNREIAFFKLEINFII